MVNKQVQGIAVYVGCRVGRVAVTDHRILCPSADCREYSLANQENISNVPFDGHIDMY